jgi:hypothetical protein
VLPKPFRRRGDQISLTCVEPTGQILHQTRFADGLYEILPLTAGTRRYNRDRIVITASGGRGRGSGRGRRGGNARGNPEAGVQASVTELDHLFFQKRNTALHLRPGASVCVEGTLFQSVGPTVPGTWCRRDAGLSPKRCPWVEPVPKSSLTEWTHDDQLRQPVFLGLRTDKESKDVVRE